MMWLARLPSKNAQRVQLWGNPRLKSIAISPASLTFTSDIDDIVMGSSEANSDRIVNYLSWMQIFSLYSSKDCPPDKSKLLLVDSDLRFRIHDFLSSLRSSENVMDALDSNQLLAYLLAYDDSSSIGEKLIKATRAREKATNTHFYSTREKALLIIRMLSVSKNPYCVKVLRYFVVCFFASKEFRQSLNLKPLSIEYEAASLAKAIVHLYSLPDFQRSDSHEIIKILFTSYRAHLGSSYRGGTECISIPIAEFLTGLEAQYPMLKITDVVDVIECYFLLLSMKPKLLLNADRTFLARMVNRVAPEDLSSLFSRIALLPSFPHFYSNSEAIFLNYPFFAFLCRKMPISALIKSTRAQDSLGQFYKLACIYLGILRWESMSELIFSNLKLILSTVLGPSLLVQNNEAIYPLLGLLWQFPKMQPFTESLMNQLSQDICSHRFIISWIICEICNLNQKCHSTDGMRAGSRHGDPNNMRHTRQFPNGKSRYTDDDFVLILINWYKRSSLYRGSVSSICRLSSSANSIDKFLFSVFKYNLKLTQVASIIHLSSKCAPLSLSTFVGAIEPFAWINLISNLWHRKRYMCIVDFFKLFVHDYTDDHNLHYHNDPLAILLPLDHTQFRYIPHQGDLKDCNPNYFPSPGSLRNKLSSLHPKIIKPSKLFVKTFMNPLLDEALNVDRNEFLFLTSDSISDHEINPTLWYASKSYREYHHRRFVHIIVITLAIKSHWRLVIGLLSIVKELLPRYVALSKMTNHLMKNLIYFQEFACGGPIDILHPKLKIYNSTNSPLVNQTHSIKVVHLPPEADPIRYSQGPYLLIEATDDRIFIPCRLPCVPDDVPFSLFCTYLKLIHWDNPVLDEIGKIAGQLPQQIKDVGMFRFYLKQEGGVFSPSQIKVLERILFTIQVRAMGEKDLHNHDQVC